MQKNKFCRLVFVPVFLTAMAGCDNDSATVSVDGDQSTASFNEENTSSEPTVFPNSGNNPPVPRLTVNRTSGTAPLEISVNARGSYDPDSDELSYRWNLGDGNQEDGWSATHRYETAGDYTVRLVVKDDRGKSSSVVEQIQVKAPEVAAPPVANQSPIAKIQLNTSATEAPVTVRANASGSYDPEGAVLSFQWKMGDGTSYDSWAVDHVYNTPGTYSIKLAVRDAGGKTTTTSEQVIVASVASAEVEEPATNNSIVASTGQGVRSPVGTNVTPIRDWVASQPFVDIFRSAKSFYKENGNSISYDANGWPKNLNGKTANTFIVSSLADDAIPVGKYTVLYDGEGEFDFNYGTVLEEFPGKKILKFTDFKRVLELRITQSNPSNHIRNFRIIMPGGICAGEPTIRVSSADNCADGNYLDFETHHKTVVFNPDYLRFMKNFSVLRFMDFMDTNHSEVSNWSEMVTYEAATWGVADKGKSAGPVSVMVKLANQLDADPWFTLPHLATDDYVRNFADYVRDNLKPGLKVYVEYSNEVWNGMFSQATYAKQKGVAQNLDSNADWAQLKFYAKRSVQIFKIWENSFGGTNRLVRVLASQSRIPKKSEIILSFQDAYKSADALAIAPYFGGDPTYWSGIFNVNTLFEKLNNPDFNHSVHSVIDDVLNQKEIADDFAVDLISYEGGQHLADWRTKTDNQHPNPMFYQANNDPRMRDLYRELLQNWKMAGGQLFVHYSAPHTWNKFGSWGLKEHLNSSDQSPKFSAVMQYIDSNPQWW